MSRTAPVRSERGAFAPIRENVLSIAASVPWCCVLPAALGALSAGGATVARLWLVRATWLLLPVTIALIGRAFWLLYVKRQGAPWVRGATWASAVASASLWLTRIVPLLTNGSS